jgi:DNA repair exonuclease SbcCD ATPase subunit
MRAADVFGADRGRERNALTWLEDERREALRRAEALRAKVLASRRLLSEELSRRRAYEGVDAGGVRRGSTSFASTRTTPTASPTKIGRALEEERSAHKAKTERLRRETTDLNGKLDDLRQKLDRASVGGSHSGSANASPMKAERPLATGMETETSNRARETMRENFERELAEARREASVKCEAYRREAVEAKEESETAKKELAAAVEALRVERVQSERLASAVNGEEGARRALMDEAIGRTRAECESKFAAEREELRNAAQRHAQEIETLKSELASTKAEFEAHKNAEESTLSSQIAQQTTIQHNLVQELTEAKSAEQIAKAQVKQLEARVREVTHALDIAKKEMSSAAKDQNDAVMMKEQSMNSNFDTRVAEARRDHERREAELQSRIERLENAAKEDEGKIHSLRQELAQATEALGVSAKAERESTAKVAALEFELKEVKVEMERVRDAATKSSANSSRESTTRIETLENRRAELENELKTSAELYERNEAEYQKLIEKVTKENEELRLSSGGGGGSSTDAEVAQLHQQNSKLKRELERVSKALQELESQDEGFFGALLGGGAASASKQKIKDLEAHIDALTSDLATKSELEAKLQTVIAEHEELKRKHAAATPASTLGSFFGF